MKKKNLIDVIIKKYNQSQNYVFPKGTTGIIEETKKLWKDVEVSDEPVPMDLV